MSGKPPVKAVVFDIGATLVTGPPVAPNKVIAALLGDVTAAEVAAVIMTTELHSPEACCEALERRFGKLNGKIVSAISDLWHAQSGAPQEIEGATEAVLALKDKGMRIGLLSDIWTPYFAGVEKALPRVVEAADAVILSCRTGARKPSPSNFLRVLADLDLDDPAEAVMVGDTYEHDILPALELGMRTVWVLARPEREHGHVVRVLNDELPHPTATVGHIKRIPNLGLWTQAQVPDISLRISD